MELNIGESSSLASVSLVYDQSEYSIILKWKSNKTRYLRLNRTSSFNQWTRLAFSINQTRGVLTYSENGVIVAEMSIEREPGGISWKSVAIGRSHSLAKTRFLKSFAIRKLTIERFDDDALLFYSVHKNTENESRAIFGIDECKYEKLNIVDLRHSSKGCQIDSYPSACSDKIGSKQTLSSFRGRTSIRMGTHKRYRSAYISDMYGCLHLRCQSHLSLLHVFVKDSTDNERLIFVGYTVGHKWIYFQISAESAAVEQAMNLFHPKNVLFQDSLWWSLKVLAFLTVCGLTWEITRAMRISRQRRVHHQNDEMIASRKKQRLELETTVTEFYNNAREIFRRFSIKHREERKQLVNQTKQTARRYDGKYAWIKP